MARLILGFALGGFAGALALFAVSRRARRRIERLEEGRQQLARDRRRVIEFMRLMAEALGENLGLQEIRQRIVHASILCTGALSACIFDRIPGDRMRGVAVEGLFPPHRPLAGGPQGGFATRARFIEEILKSEEFAVGEGVVGRVAQTGRGEMIAGPDAPPAGWRDPALVVRSVIAVPLAFRGRSFGVLAVANPADERPFTEVEFSLMESLAEQAALALHNTEFLSLQIEKSQLDLDLSIASGIQRMLLPRRVAIVPGLDIDARYAPAQRVGGDLYDVIELPGGRLGVAVADVSGKGISASLMMAIVRTNLRQLAVRTASPSEALKELNRVVAGDIEGGLFVTVLYAVIDVARSTATFARAGHELPLFVRPDPSGGTSARFVGSEGMPVGMVPDDVFSAAIDERTEPFGAGDVLVFYTDGVTEAPNVDQKEFSGARLAEAVRALHGRPAFEINEGILDSVRRFTGGAEQRDDFTLVTVCRTQTDAESIKQ